MPSKKEQFLLFRIRAFKDEEAFESLLELYSAPLQRFLYSKLPTHPDVQDAFSNLMLRLWEYISQTPVEHFSGLAHTIARGIVAEFYRQREGKETVAISEGEGESGVIPESAFSAEQIETHVDTNLLIKRIKQMDDEDDREVLLLRFVEGYSVKEIAAYLGKTENATSVLIHRAKQKLRLTFEK